MVKNINIKIDGKDVKSKEGMTILEAAKQLGIEIPTMCYHEELENYGACRICSVEIELKGRTQIVASCCYPIKEGLQVKTKSPKIDRIRKTIIELAAISAGEDIKGDMRKLADEYNADLSRFRKIVPIKPNRCILCGLCVRRCIEATWDGAIGFVGRGANRCIAEFIEKKELCSICNYCREVCPTGRIKSNCVDPPFPSFDDFLAGRK